MKYFIINTIYRDGEYEYLSQSTCKAKTEAEAWLLATQEAEEWTANDYREFKVDVRAEITEKEYQVISQYIY